MEIELLIARGSPPPEKGGNVRHATPFGQDAQTLIKVRLSVEGTARTLLATKRHTGLSFGNAALRGGEETDAVSSSETLAPKNR